jgi:hypothetical protein
MHLRASTDVDHCCVQSAYAALHSKPYPDTVVRRELGEACEVYDCPLDEDTLDVFAWEIAAGERVEIDAGTIRVLPDGPGRSGWTGATGRFDREWLAGARGAPAFGGA